MHPRSFFLADQRLALSTPLSYSPRTSVSPARLVAHAPGAPLPLSLHPRCAVAAMQLCFSSPLFGGTDPFPFSRKERGGIDLTYSPSLRLPSPTPYPESDR